MYSRSKLIASCHRRSHLKWHVPRILSHRNRDFWYKSQLIQMIIISSVRRLSEVRCHKLWEEIHRERDQHAWKCYGWVLGGIFLLLYTLSHWAHQMQAAGAAWDEGNEARVAVSADEANHSDRRHCRNVSRPHAHLFSGNAGIFLLLRRIRIYQGVSRKVKRFY